MEIPTLKRKAQSLKNLGEVKSYHVQEHFGVSEMKYAPWAPQHPVRQPENDLGDQRPRQPKLQGRSLSKLLRTQQRMPTKNKHVFIRITKINVFFQQITVF